MRQEENEESALACLLPVQSSLPPSSLLDALAATVAVAVVMGPSNPCSSFFNQRFVSPTASTTTKTTTTSRIATTWYAWCAPISLQLPSPPPSAYMAIYKKSCLYKKSHRKRTLVLAVKGRPAAAGQQWDFGRCSIRWLPAAHVPYPGMLLSTDTNITIGPAVDRCPCEYLVALGVYRFHFFFAFFPFSLILYLSCFPIVRSYSAPFNGCVTAGVTTGSIASNYTVHYATRLSSIFFFVVKLPLFASHLFLSFWFWPSIDHGQPSRHSWLSVIAPQ